jgi:hypothetical protein
MSLLAIDPGKRGSGVALFDKDTKELLRAAYVRNRCVDEDDLALCASMAHAIRWWHAELGVFAPVTDVVVERPRIYTASKQRGKDGNWRDPNDLPPLFGVDVGVAVLFPNATPRSCFPRDWTGTLDKPAMNARTLQRLTDVERGRIASEPEHLYHNILDAIGIGLHFVGRGFIGEARRRVYPR